MNNQPQKLTDADTQEQANVLAMLSEHLLTIPASQNLLDSLEKRLEHRIQTSITRHAGLSTIRAKDGVWRDLISGIRYKLLWESSQGNSVLIEFAPGASLPGHRHNFLEEGLVLSGGLQLDDIELNRFDYHVSPAGSLHGSIHSRQGALAYLRGSSLGKPSAMLKEVLGSLLPENSRSSQSIRHHEGGWIEVQQGFFQKNLWSDSAVSSRIYKIEAGSCIEGHYHPLNEECMMLSGEIFLGDILIQEGDYHLAAAGTEHLEITSDTGALLYVRGHI